MAFRQPASSLREHVLKFEFPNLEYRAANETLAAKIFGPRMTKLKSPTTYDDAWDVPKSDYCKYEQSHPFWLTWREKARMTGSVSGEAVLFHAAATAKYLDLPKSMHDHSPSSDFWRVLQLRLVHGKIPRSPFGMPASVFAMWGKIHEDTVLYNFLTVFPQWHYYECGLSIITDELLRSRNLVNQLTGKKIVDFPIELGDSADGLLEYTDPATGQTERVALELKAPTFFIPKDACQYTPGARFEKIREIYCHPYPCIKPYYLPQCMFHMLALGVDTCFFVSWTYPGGMSVWVIRFSDVYMSLLLTVMTYIHVEYSSQNKLVPNNLFDKDDGAASEEAKTMYKQLVDMTKSICDTTKPLVIPPEQEELFPDFLKNRPDPEPVEKPSASSAPAAKRYKKERPTPTIDGWMTKAITNRISDTPTSGYTNLRNMSTGYIPLIRMFMFGVAVLGDDIGLAWTKEYEDLAIRTANIRAIAATKMYNFSSAFAEKAILGLMYRPTVRFLYEAKSAALESMEIIYADSLRAVFCAMSSPDGSALDPEFPQNVMADYQTLVAGIAKKYEENADTYMRDSVKGLSEVVTDEALWLARLKAFATNIATGWIAKKGTKVDKDKTTDNIESLAELAGSIPATPAGEKRNWIAQVIQASLVLRILARNIVAP